MSDVFYKMRLVDNEDGLSVITTEYIPIHETNCIFFCVDKFFINRFFHSYLMKEDESKIKFAKRINIPVRQVHKSGSRIAFETKEQAFQHLIWMKQRQNIHMNRQIAFNNAFIEKCKSIDDLVMQTGCRVDFYNVPDTRDLVHQWLRFE